MSASAICPAKSIVRCVAGSKPGAEYMDAAVNARTPVGISDAVVFVVTRFIPSSAGRTDDAVSDPCVNETAADVTACHAEKLATNTSACDREPVTFGLCTGFIRHMIGKA